MGKPFMLKGMVLDKLDHLQKVPIWKLVLVTVISALSAYSILRSLPRTWTDKEFQVSLVMAFYVCLAFGIGFVLKRSKIPMLALFGKPKEMFSLAYLVFVVLSLFLFTFGSFYLVHYALSFLAPDYVAEVISESAYVRKADSQHSLVFNILLFLVLVLIAPVFEEIVFRGIVLYRWKKSIGLGKAIVFSSLAFSILHFDLLGNFLFSIVMVVFVIRTQSLLVPVFCHAMNNLIGVSIEPFLEIIGKGDFRWTLEIFRQYVWTGMVCLVLAVPFILQFFRTNGKFLFGSGSNQRGIQNA